MSKKHLLIALSIVVCLSGIATPLIFSHSFLQYQTEQLQKAG